MLPLRQLPLIAVVLGMDVSQETRHQEHHVLTILLAQRINALV